MPCLENNFMFKLTLIVPRHNSFIRLKLRNDPWKRGKYCYPIVLILLQQSNFIFQSCRILKRHNHKNQRWNRSPTFYNRKKVKVIDDEKMRRTYILTHNNRGAEETHWLLTEPALKGLMNELVKEILSFFVSPNKLKHICGRHFNCFAFSTAQTFLSLIASELAAKYPITCCWPALFWILIKLLQTLWSFFSTLIGSSTHPNENKKIEAKNFFSIVWFLFNCFWRFWSETFEDYLHVVEIWFELLSLQLHLLLVKRAKRSSIRRLMISRTIQKQQTNAPITPIADRFVYGKLWPLKRCTIIRIFWGNSPKIFKLLLGPVETTKQTRKTCKLNH